MPAVTDIEVTEVVRAEFAPAIFAHDAEAMPRARGLHTASDLIRDISLLSKDEAAELVDLFDRLYKSADFSEPRKSVVVCNLFADLRRACRYIVGDAEAAERETAIAAKTEGAAK